jgi:hypothetical protein
MPRIISLGAENATIFAAKDDATANSELPHPQKTPILNAPSGDRFPLIGSRGRVFTNLYNDRATGLNDAHQQFGAVVLPPTSGIPICLTTTSSPLS